MGATPEAFRYQISIRPAAGVTVVLRLGRVAWGQPPETARGGLPSREHPATAAAGPKAGRRRW